MKSGQVEFETMKYEVKRLVDEVDVMQSAAEEANKLKTMAERQVRNIYILKMIMSSCYNNNIFTG